MRRRLIFLFLVSLVLGFALSRPAKAVNCGDTLPSDQNQLNDYIASCNQKIAESQQQQQTLKAALTVLNSKISLTTAQITQTVNQINALEKDIANLSVVVSDLDRELNNLAKVYVARVQQSYLNRNLNSLSLFLSSDSISDFLTAKRYLSIAKSRDQVILTEMESAKTNYDFQKNQKIEKQQQVQALKTKLDSQKADLNAQQKSKQSLLTQTQNNEKKFQALLAQARAELEAITAILAGKGQEVDVGNINKGDLIAKVIQGASCNSGGTHLHFMVVQGNTVQNPFNYLKPGVDYVNCSGSSCGSSDGDPFNPGGQFDWPINPQIKFNQGYGVTWAVRNTWAGSIYSQHNGIDISGTNDEVRAVANGHLYRGTYSGQNGCALKYVRVAHKDSDITTYYLHVNYTL